jgi:hypothetical protein
MGKAEKKSYRTEIIVALIGVAGVLGAAVIANWDKIFKEPVIPPPESHVEGDRGREREPPERREVPASERYETRIGWSGGGKDWCSFWVMVHNNTDHDVYVKQLEFERERTGRQLVSRFPELVPERPFVRAGDARQILSLRVDATQRELTQRGIRAKVTIIESDTVSPAMETPDNTVVSISRPLGN